jgi:feruloyl esterase
MTRFMIQCLCALMVLCTVTAARANAAPITPEAARREQVDRCQALMGSRFIGLPNAATYVTSAVYVPAALDRPAYCDVEGYVNPTVGIGLWLPARDWNGKYLVRGCGGSCGAVQIALACKVHIRMGYACLTTDMGHRGTQSDNNWAANNLEGQVDFGFRATHVATVAGKAITKAYYNQNPKWSYFYGCSTGGRQGMVEAQHYPDDFDGIFAMAPASGRHITPAERELAKAFDRRAFNLDAAGRIILPIRKIPMLHRAVVAFCDMNDGIKDGVIGDPRDCAFDPASIQCKTVETRDCLTQAQVGVVRAIYKYTGLMPGSELNWINDIIVDTPPSGDGGGQSRGDPNVFPILADASNPDLRSFKEHGGKLINAQGWEDHQINPLATIDYYELATRAMGGPDRTRDFYRLFMIPGTNHCASGDGPYGIDYMAALEAWVEKGQAPEMLVGVHPKLGSAVDFSNPAPTFLKPGDVDFTRPIYPYPKKAVYSGQGDPNATGSYVAR